MDKLQRIGFVGLGMMGLPMAERLLGAGFEVFGADTNGSRMAQFTAQANAAALTDADVSCLDVLITMLPSSAVVEDVLLGQSGWARRLRSGSVVLDMSSSEPGRSRALSRTLGAMGVQYLDAPVSGGVKRAQTGALAIMVGGEASALERCRPLLSVLGSTVIRIGEAGSGHAAKALNNYVSAAGLVATVEALHVAARFGIDPRVMTEVLNASSGRTNTSENKVRQFMLTGAFDSGFALLLMNKDIKIALALAREEGYAMPLGQACAELWDDASKRSGPDTDHTEMFRLLAEHGR